ncbi:MAG TPA: Na+/H+ antiporter NhaA [Gemmatimonadota bacterium]|nr:Na+/H+ antiporter NhaA [Gemmatimonadota bacterium]
MATAGPRRRFSGPLDAFQRFAQLEASGGILLLACAIAALVLANTPWADAYFGFWQSHLRIGWNDFVLDESLLHWINDGLMAVFFFVVGLEIKRELLAGELSSPRQAALPMVAAVGGMLVPAALYAALNAGGEAAAGWGVPMATDIAFALGVLALLGDRVPVSLKVFLTALAIVDDLGAILVIALFYTGDVAAAWLGVGGIALVGLVALNLAGVRYGLPYGILGMLLWFAFLQSGVHATVAGVLAALTIPATARIDGPEFLARGRDFLSAFGRATERTDRRLADQGQQDALHALEEAIEEVSTPLQKLEHALHPWVTYFILPLFALANAGVTVEGGVTGRLVEPIGLGIILGLVVGKQVGVTLFAWLAVRLGLADLPPDVGWLQVYGVAWLAGIGFTMSLFIAGLAFPDGAELLPAAKLAILVASVISGLGGWLVLARTNGARE